MLPKEVVTDFDNNVCFQRRGVLKLMMMMIMMMMMMIMMMMMWCCD